MVNLPEPIARYFDAIRARDADAIEQVFTEGAELVTAAGTFTGRAAIGAFYRDLAFAIADLMPAPRAAVVDGDRVAVEIDLTMNGTVSRVADFFTLEGGLIRQVVIYSG